MHELFLRHTTATGHRIPGHENGKGKCARLHGHTYVWEVTMASPSLLPEGFVLDFGVIKRTLDIWDHRMILWDQDPAFGALTNENVDTLGAIYVPFSPTAENMARYWANHFYSELKCAHGGGYANRAEGEGFAVQVEVWESPNSSARYVAR